MPNYTPGPWHIEAGIVWAEAADGSNVRVAHATAILNYISSAERNANLALIAAAPELVDALTQLLSITIPAIDESIVAYAKRTLAKAKGEPNVR